MKHFSEQICKWYLLNFRKLPWRNTKNPYKIWVSEIILQQTRVNQGLNYYHTFIKTFPTVKDLAQSPEDKVLKVWQGLGYYSRARNMHKAAKMVMTMHNGNFPTDYHALLELAGIGPYTAAAIASFTANQPYAVVDGNVLRVLARYYNISDPINSATGKKNIEQLAAETLNPKNAATHNQAIMELGALVCTPKPNCSLCPVNETCEALRKGKTDVLPVKNAKTSVRNRYISFYLITNGKEVLLRKRTGQDIWKGLYDFPAQDVENKKPTATSRTQYIKKVMGSIKFSAEVIKPEIIHLLSHRRLHIHFIIVKANRLPTISACRAVKISRVKSFALPKPIEQFIKKHPRMLV